MFGAEKRIELGWLVAQDKLPKGALKLLLNLALIAGDSLVRGGRLDIDAEVGDGRIELAIRAEGPKLVLDPSIREILGSGVPAAGPVEPRAAGAWLAHALVEEAGGTIRLSDPSAELLVVGATLPVGATP
jgi:histidine phosphotransferase ChpT